MSKDSNSSFNLLNCFSDKCKQIRNNFKNITFPLSKDSIDFKFNFYKSLCDLNFTNKFNINRSEFYFLKKFKKEKPFKVIDCDKNIGICFIDNIIYNNFVEDHLRDRETYELLLENPIIGVSNKIKDKIEILCSQKHISNQLGKKLINHNSKLGSIRLLAKLQKEKLKFRPIINCTSHPTLFLCLLIDIILQTFVKKTKSFILDSQNLIQKTFNSSFEKKQNYTLVILNRFTLIFV